jgi:uncharacterized membrane protein YidH (DUF202 family)
VTPPPEDDVTRRTWPAAERTWLAWWRSGIATGTAGIAGRAAYMVERALDRGGHRRVGESGMLALTLAGVALALGTFVVILAQA